MQPATIYCSTCGAGNRSSSAFCFSCGQTIHIGTLPSSADTVRMSPQQVLKQRYEIVTLVGKGGMGAVYKAEDTQFGNRLVALKEMSQSNLSPQEASEATEQFKREAHMLANLKHPNLPSIYDYFSENGRWYLVMDFIEGTTLDARLDKASGHFLSINETLEIGIQLAKVLGYLHTRPTPIIFRDLKPFNIMITPDNDLYLIDFGIARFFKIGKDKDTVAYVSPGYAAPEQFGRTQTSPQSDIYSLGATLHQLLSGNEPRSNMPLFTFKPLRSYNPNIPTTLADLIAKMVNIDPALRPASMVEIRKELERIQMQVKQPLSQLPPTQYAPPPPPPVTPKSAMPTPRPAASAYSYTPPPYAQRQQQAYYTPSSQTPAKPALPKGKVWKTLLIGIVTGILGFGAEGSLYVGGILRNIIVVGILVLIAGLIVGRMVVLRRTGFFMGCIATITYFALFLINYPYYRYSFFYGVGLIYVLIVMLATGPMGWFGAWLTTIKHPYYKKP